MDYLSKIITDIEVLSAEGLKDCFMNGIDPNMQHRNNPLIYELVSGYARGPGFSKCVKVFTEHGLKFNDPALLAVLLNDANMLEDELAHHPAVVQKTYTIDCAFTQLHEASLLHICAEFNHLDCAVVLVNHGIHVNNTSGVDGHGFGMQTPIFHTVNQHNQVCNDMMYFLAENGADLTCTVKGLIWGKGYPWETFIPAINPISYALMGLLPQFHRRESHVFENISYLLKKAYQIDYRHPNIPNKYLSND